MKRIISAFLVILMLVCTTTVPVRAAVHYTGKTVDITTKTGYARSYLTYDTKEEADAAPIVFYAAQCEFPIEVVVQYAEGCRPNFYSFDSYGVKNVYDWWRPGVYSDREYTYAVIDIEPYPIGITGPIEKKKEPTEDEIIDDKLDQLLEELNLGFCYDKSTPYAKELRAFLTGEWDGDRIDDQDPSHADFVASRYVRNRTYVWDGMSLYTGEYRKREVNVDYIGYLEVIPGYTTAQDFSLAVSRANKTIEQWRLLEKIDSWQLPIDAGSIDKIYPLGQNSDDPNACQAIIYAIGADDLTYIYSLYPDGRIEKVPSGF